MSNNNESQLVLSRPFFAKQEISRLRKFTILDLRNYNQKTLSIIKFLNDISNQLQFPRRTLETAIYFYQRYYLFNRFETEYCFTIATSCMFLSSKQVETIKKLAEICTVSLRLRGNSKVNNEMLENFKKRVLQVEQRILECCCFDFRTNTSLFMSEFIVKIGKELNIDHDTCKLAWIMAYDVLKIDLLIIVPAPVISFALLKLANNIRNPENTIVWNYLLEEFELPEKLIFQAYFEILNMFINMFDICDLKNNSEIHSIKLDSNAISIETFISIKQKCGPEQPFEMLSEDHLDADAYINEARDFRINERRYVLHQNLVQEEVDVSANASEQ